MRVETRCRSLRRLLICFALGAGVFGGLVGAEETAKAEGVQPGAEGAAVVVAADFDSLNDAMAALPAGGGLVQLPAGRIEVTAPVVVRRDDVMLRGCGTATHLVNLNTEGQPALLFEPPEGREKIWRVQIADLRITGNPKSGAGLVAKGVNELLLSRVSVEHNGGGGVVLDACYEDPRVSDCLFTYNKGTGLDLLGCHDIVVSANQFEENVDALHCINGYNLTMTGNNLDDHLGNGVVIENTYGSVLSGNMIEECNGHAAVLKGACYGNALSANTFAHCKGEGLRLVGVRDITVSANTFVLLAEPAVHILEDACQITITGNTFNSYPFDPAKRHKLDPGQGILLENTHDVTVSGNLFSSPYREAIKVAGEANARINITGNTILNASRVEAGACAAVALENVTGSIFANNLISDSQKEPTMRRAVLFEGACGGNVVVGNVITGDPEGLSVPGEGNQVGLNIVR